MTLYDTFTQSVLDQVPASARSILDLGCGGGLLGAALKARSQCSVVGVTFNPEEAALARDRLDRVEVADLNSFDPSVLGKFDCVVCSHILEHLMAPERLLARLHDCLDQSGSLIVALPNILFYKERVQLARGRFRYAQFGVMDRTHLRFYDWVTAANLLTDAGYAICHRFGDGGFPFSRFLPRFIRRILDRRAVKWFPGLCAIQFVFRCQPVPKSPTGAEALPRKEMVS